MIDLHLHSTCSDGSERPSRVVELAAEAGCSAIALTDHDGMEGLAEAAARADDLGVDFVGGCEISCRDHHGTVHLLVYFVDAGGPMDRSLLDVRADRTRRNEELLAKLRWLGMPLDPDELAAEAGPGVVGRPHFAALLVRHGHARSIDDAFERLLADDKAAFVERAVLAPATVIEWAAAEGAVVSFAHPLSVGLDDRALRAYVGTLAEVGLTGLECVYSRYDETTRETLSHIARDHGLVPTGGSDFHGRYKPDLSVGTGLGDLCVDDSVLDELRSRHRAIT